MGNIDKKVLDNVYQTSKIGLDSAEYLYGKTQDRSLKNEINEYVKKYYNILLQTKNKMETIYNRQLEGIPLNKELMWNGVQNISATTKKEDIAKMLLEGSKKGISQIIRYSNNEMLNEDVRKLANTLIIFEKENIQNIQKYI